MSWPVGYGIPGIDYHTAGDGSVHANGMRVTGERGWLDVPLPPAAIRHGAPCALSIRIRIVPEAQGGVFIYAEEVVADGRRYNGIFNLVTSDGGSWGVHLTAALHSAIADRMTAQLPIKRTGRRPIRPPSGQRLAAQGSAWDATDATGSDD